MGRTWRRNGSEYDPSRESWRNKRDKREDRRLRKLLNKKDTKSNHNNSEEEDTSINFPDEEEL